MESKSYQVRVRYVFEGVYTIKSDTRENAIRLVEKDCGFVMGGSIHSTLNDDALDWNFSIHPEMIIRSVRLAKRNKKR